MGRGIASLWLLLAVSGCAGIGPQAGQVSSAVSGHAGAGQQAGPGVARPEKGPPVEQVSHAHALKASRGIVFVVDGDGHFLCTTHNFHEAVQGTSFPLAIETVEWGHGYYRILADHLDRSHIRQVSQKLTEQVRSARQRLGPAAPIYLLAQSGGCPLALAATEALPPETVDRIILLAPPVSATYDLRPALRCTRQNIDVFYSPHDRFILGLCTAVLGTSDRCWTAPAGRVGFRLPRSMPEAASLYGKLRQHCWHPEMEWTGYDGGHLSINKAAFLRAYVLPLLQENGRDELSKR